MGGHKIRTKQRVEKPIGQEGTKQGGTPTGIIIMRWSVGGIK